MSAINNQQNAMALELAALKAELANLKAGKTKGPQKAIKAGTSGTVVLTGYRQFPFSFFKAEILDILQRADEIKNFIAANDASLNQGKNDKRFEAAKAAAAAQWASKQAHA